MGSATRFPFCWGDGAGNFTLASSPTVDAGPTSLAVADFNGDGKLDLAVSNGGGDTGDTVSVLLGDGTGNFTLATSPVVGSTPGSIAVGDFNRDGKLDLAVVNVCGNGNPGCASSTLSVLLGDGTGGFTTAPSPTTTGYLGGVAAGDFNGDGNLDLAVASGARSNTPGTVSILLGTVQGNLTLARLPARVLIPRLWQWATSTVTASVTWQSSTSLAR